MKENTDFSNFEKELAQFSKCLANPARIEILIILSKHKDRTCKEIVAELPLSQSTVSKHLKDLLKLHEGQVALAIASYNAGQGAVNKHGQRIPAYRETMLYVPAVLSYMARYSSDAQSAPNAASIAN